MKTPSGMLILSLLDQSSQAEIVEAARSVWRAFVGEPLAELPWNTSIEVLASAKGFDSTVTMRWEKKD